MVAGDVQHGTLVADTEKVITLSAHFTTVTVLNRNGLGEIYYTVDGTDPGVGQEGSYVCPAAIWAETLSGIQQGPDNKTVVKLISHAACTFSVMGQ